MLDAIKDHIAQSLAIEQTDFDDGPFNRMGGLGKVYQLFGDRLPKEKRTPDEHDAYAVARWLSESAARGVLDRYFTPPLTLEERRIAEIEGWILGIA